MRFLLQASSVTGKQHRKGDVILGPAAVEYGFELLLLCVCVCGYLLSVQPDFTFLRTTPFISPCSPYQWLYFEWYGQEDVHLGISAIAVSAASRHSAPRLS